MANLAGVLGTMLATGLGGRSARGPAFATSPGGMGGGMGGRNMAGLAALGYLAYKAYQQHKATDPAAPGAAGTGAAAPYGQARSASGTGPSLGDRMGDLLSRGPAPQDPGPEISDQKALLLIRAMVAAARADGEIDAQERDTILRLVEQAGGGAEERRILERELADPPSLDDIVAQVRDPDTAEQVYLASEMAIRPDGPAETSYLQYLAARLNLSGERLEALRRSA